MRQHRHRVLAAFALVPALVLGLAGCTGGAAVDAVKAAPDTAFSDDVVARLDGALADSIAKSRSVGAIAAVWAPGLGTWKSGAGWSDLSTQASMTPDMSFRLGTGGTQAMTCSVVAQLADEKKVDLDAPVAEYLPSLPGVGTMTLRQLCNGTSGLADFATQLWPSYLQNPEREWPTLELLANAQSHQSTGAPGASYSSSATGPLVAGLVATTVSGRSWESLYNEMIVEHYGLEKTQLPSATTVELPEPHAEGYSFGLTGVGGTPVCEALYSPTKLSPSAFGAAGGAVTTIDDMRKLVSGIANAPLSDEVWKSNPIAGVADWQKVGLGVTELGPMRGFSGQVPGYLTAAFTDPTSGYTVAIMLSNSSAGADFARESAQRLIAIVSESATAAGKTDAPQLPWQAGSYDAVLGVRAVCQ